MEVEILKTKKIGTRTWHLCQGNLLSYLEQLKPSFYDFAIQRRIVKNQYLDKIYKTIKNGDPIPIITITADHVSLNPDGKNKAEIDMNTIEILDGLQRTFRLWSYKVLSDRYKGEVDKEITAFAKRLKEENDLFFESGVLSTTLIRTLINNNEIQKINETFKTFDIYFVIWEGLDEKEIIDKMLVLNAGQKAVSKTHQFELLFLHFYDEVFVKQDKITLLREKDKKANSVKTGNRDVGEFMFSSVIVALQSFAEMKPLRVSTEDLVGNEPETEIETKLYKALFSKDFVNKYLTELYLLDELINKVDKNKGKEWFVKDTTLSGIFAALGKHINIENNWDKSELIKHSETGFNLLKKSIERNGLELEAFNDEYNILSSRQVNIGNFIRKVVMLYILELLQNGTPKWSSIFEKAKQKG